MDHLRVDGECEDTGTAPAGFCEMDHLQSKVRALHQVVLHQQVSVKMDHLQ